MKHLSYKYLRTIVLCLAIYWYTNVLPNYSNAFI